MYQIIKCPKHQKDLVFYKDTSTHTLFKCPCCDYVHYPGVVHHDLPEKYKQLQAEKKDLEETIEGAKCSLDRFDFLRAWKLLDRALKEK